MFGEEHCVQFSCSGDAYAVTLAGRGVEGFEPLPPSEAAYVLSLLQESQQYPVLHDIFETFALGTVGGTDESDAAQLLIDDVMDTGLARIGLSRQPRIDAGLTFARAPDLAELGEPPQEEHWIEVEVLDADGDPIAGIEVDIRPPSGALRSGKTNLFGHVRVEGIPNAGDCQISLPELDENDIPEDPAMEPVALSFEVVDEDGPCANLELSVELPDGTTRSVCTDAAGTIKLEEIPEGMCTISEAQSAQSA